MKRILEPMDALHVRVPPALKEQMVSVAHANRRSLTAEVGLALERYVSASPPEREATAA